MTASTRGQKRQGAAGRRGLLARLIAARELQARRQVNAYLGSFDDATLATYGYDRRSLDQTGQGPLPL